MSGGDVLSRSLVVVESVVLTTLIFVGAGNIVVNSVFVDRSRIVVLFTILLVLSLNILFHERLSVLFFYKFLAPREYW